MELKSTAQSGSLESSDVLVVVEPASKGGRKIELESVVINEYGDSIKADVESVLNAFEIKNLKITINDRGALTPTIKARVEAALVKSSKGEES